MNDDKYIEILRQKVLPFFADDQHFQQDYATCHKPSKVLSFYEEEGIALLPDWPAMSPNLKIFEILWDYLKIQVSKHNIPNLQILWTIVQTEFFNFPGSFIENLFESIPRRIDAIIKNKVNPIRS